MLCIVIHYIFVSLFFGALISNQICNLSFTTLWRNTCEMVFVNESLYLDEDREVIFLCVGADVM